MAWYAIIKTHKKSGRPVAFWRVQSSEGEICFLAAMLCGWPNYTILGPYDAESETKVAIRESIAIDEDGVRFSFGEAPA